MLRINVVLVSSFSKWEDDITPFALIVNVFFPHSLSLFFLTLYICSSPHLLHSSSPLFLSLLLLPLPSSPFCPFHLLLFFSSPFRPHLTSTFPFRTDRKEEGKELLSRRNAEYKLPFPLLEPESSLGDEDDSVMRKTPKRPRSQLKDYLQVSSAPS